MALVDSKVFTSVMGWSGGIFSKFQEFGSVEEQLQEWLRETQEDGRVVEIVGNPTQSSGAFEQVVVTQLIVFYRIHPPSEERTQDEVPTGTH